MTFTDDDLKRLKNKEGYWRDGYEMRKANKFQIAESWGWVDGIKIEALIARLEAAEALMGSPCGCGWRLQHENGELAQAWRNAAGK